MKESNNSGPCWFMNLNDNSVSSDIINERENRELYGYQTAISLSEAVRIFNQEKQCVASLASYPPLTEEEVVAAIAVGVNENGRGEMKLPERDEIWKIASQKMMPKGSLIRADNGGRIQESPVRPYGTIQAKGIRISLLIGLDKNDRSDLPKPPKSEQILLIRNTFSEIEIIK